MAQTQWRKTPAGNWVDPETGDVISDRAYQILVQRGEISNDSTGLANANPTVGAKRSAPDGDTNPSPNIYQRLPDPEPNTRQNTSNNTGQMEVDSGEARAPALASSRLAITGPGGSNAPSKETPISDPPTITYGLQETHTTILPWTGWFSVGGLSKTTINQVKIRMNQVYDMFDNPIEPAGSLPSTKIYSVPLNNAGAATSARFPVTMADGTNTQEKPQWRDYYFSLYEFYTVINCYYKIVISNPVNTPGASAIVGVQFDSYPASASSGGNVMPKTNYDEVLYYKGIQWHQIPWQQTGAGDNTIVIEGTHRPGETKRNIINDGDVKTWISTASGTAATLQDVLTLNFWRDPLSWNETAHGCNVEVTLKYTVQLKDLKEQGRYPNTISTTNQIYQVLDNQPAAPGTAHHLGQVALPTYTPSATV